MRTVFHYPCMLRLAVWKRKVYGIAAAGGCKAGIDIVFYKHNLIAAFAVSYQNSRIAAASPGYSAVIPGGYAPCVFRYRRIALTHIYKVQSRFPRKASALRGKRTAYALNVVDSFSLTSSEKLYKSFSVAAFDRKYFSSALGSKMSVSDNVDPFSVLRYAVEL